VKARGTLDEDGKFHLVLEQDPLTGRTVTCPFCGLRHSHGIGTGYRSPHCPLNHEEVFTNELGQEFRSGDGYVIVTKELSKP
jgi:hypothetical protein